MGHDIILQKGFVPGVQIEGGDVADLPADPVAFGKVALKFSHTLKKKVVTDVDAQDGQVPEIGSFLEIHRAPSNSNLRTASIGKLPRHATFSRLTIEWA